MPWIDKNECIGCGACVEQCPVDTIYMEESKAEINMSHCIHCGVCHGVCPEGAVKHDSEKVPDEIKANIEQTQKFMEDCAYYLGNTSEKQKCLKRMIKHFNKEKMVVEKTLERLEDLIK